MSNYIWRHDLVPQYERYQEEINEAIKRVLRSGRYILGTELLSFEKEFAEYIGCRYGIGVASGTDALVLALRAAGIQPGDEVITTTYAPTPTPAAIIMAGGRPVFVDVEEETALMNPGLIKENISPNTKFIIPVHLFGLPCDMAEITGIAQRYHLTVIEDAAQAHGSLLDGKKVGNFGDLSCFSFYPTKNLGGYGDGGIVLTNRVDLYEKLKLLRNYGKKNDPFNSQILGVNSRLDELQAAILRVKLPDLDAMNEARAVRVELYQNGLKDLPLSFLKELNGAKSNYHILTVICPEGRDALMEFLESQGVQTNVYYPQPLHSMPAYRPYVRDDQKFPVAEQLSREAIALPLYPELKLETVHFVIDKIREFYATRNNGVLPACR
jgi:dTDP-4-amino-4,6-dideoxygalactose transaminase